MNLHAGLRARAAAGRPIRVGLIGAGKFGTMYLAQVRRTVGTHLLGIADLAPDRARAACATAGFAADQTAAPDFARALADGTTHITDDAQALIAANGLDVVIDATGDARAGIAHALAAIEHGRHMVMVNVEADVVAGPLLARKAAAAGLVFSYAYGDQPALICEMVDWARAAGFDVVCAGKGTKYLPKYEQSTPDTVWDHYGLTAEHAAAAGMNSQMFNSFIDGTKSSIEMAAVANACGLTPPEDGLGFPPCGADQLASVCIPHNAGGVLARSGTVEVVSSVDRSDTVVERDLRWGVYVTFEGDSEYVANCFRDYGLVTDASGRYSALYRPYHLIGLELGISVANAALRGEPTGVAADWRGDVVTVAKRDLAAGEVLDGEGGFMVRGKVVPAAASLRDGLLPLGLTGGLRLINPVSEGAAVKWTDVAVDAADDAIRVRREMEQTFAAA